MKTKPKHSRLYTRRNLRLESLERRLCLTTIAEPFALPEPSFCNTAHPQDVNQDSHVTALDALLVINELNGGGARALGEGGSGDPVAMVDVNGDSQLSAVDALLVINTLNDPNVESTPTSLAEPNPTDETEPVDSTEEKPSDEPPADETPVEETPVDETPVEEPTNITNITPETPEDETPGDDTPPEETPQDDVPKDDTPVDQTPDDETQVDDPTDIINITPETPEDETPGDDTPPEETPEDDVPEDDTPDETPVDQTPGDETPDDNTDDSGQDETDESDHECHGSVGHRRDRFFDRLDANDDGLLTADEVPEGLWEQLAGVDADGDGAVSADEIAAALVEHQHPRGPLAAFDANEDGLLTEDEVPDRVWERLSQADADGDGAVSAEELAAFAAEHHPRPRGPLAAFDANNDGLLTEDEVPERVWERLSQADSDGDGAVSADEIEAFVNDHDEHPRGPLAAFDANDDGVLTEDEVPERIWERLSQADADGDGTLTAEELDAALPPRHEHDPLADFDANGDGLLTIDEVPEGIWNRLLSADANGDGSLSAEELEDLEVPPGPRPDHHGDHRSNDNVDTNAERGSRRQGGRRR